MLNNFQHDITEVTRVKQGPTQPVIPETQPLSNGTEPTASTADWTRAQIDEEQYDLRSTGQSPDQVQADDAAVYTIVPRPIRGHEHVSLVMNVPRSSQSNATVDDDLETMLSRFVEAADVDGPFTATRAFRIPQEQRAVKPMANGHMSDKTDGKSSTRAIAGSSAGDVRDG